MLIQFHASWPNFHSSNSHFHQWTPHLSTDPICIRSHRPLRSASSGNTLVSFREIHRGLFLGSADRAFTSNTWGFNTGMHRECIGNDRGNKNWFSFSITFLYIGDSNVTHQIEEECNKIQKKASGWGGCACTCGWWPTNTNMIEPRKYINEMRMKPSNMWTDSSTRVD